MNKKNKVLWKVYENEAPVCFENWFETPPIPRLQHIPLEKPFYSQEDKPVKTNKKTSKKTT